VPQLLTITSYFTLNEPSDAAGPSSSWPAKKYLMVIRHISLRAAPGPWTCAAGQRPRFDSACTSSSIARPPMTLPVARATSSLSRENKATWKMVRVFDSLVERV